MHRLLIVALLVGSTSAVANAQPSGRAEFERGRALFLEGRYPEARDQLLAAYRLSGGRSSTVLAVARCEEALEKRAEAIAWYERYLQAEPKGKVSDEARVTVARLRQEIADVAQPLQRSPSDTEPDNFDLVRRAPAPPPPSVAPPQTLKTEEPDSSSLLASPWFWTVVCVAVVGAGVGVFAATRPRADPPLGGSLMQVLER